MTPLSYHQDYYFNIIVTTRQIYRYPVDTRRRFKVYKTSIRRHQRRIDVL